MTVGYSGTPLAKKLGLKDGMRLCAESMPDSVRSEIAGEVVGLDWSCEPPIEIAHIFVTERAALESSLERLLPLIGPSGFVWVSWPKKASKVPSEILEDTIREIALPMGLVDVKVCAVDEVWSGLKLVRRRK